MENLTNNPNLEVVEGQAMTTSLDVAHNFKKRHDNVLQTIMNLNCSKNFRLLNFKEAKYNDAQGKPRPMLRMTRDGWTILVMGFKSKPAMAWKEKYINAFKTMQEALVKITMRPSKIPLTDWKVIAKWMKKAGNSENGDYAVALQKEGFSMTGEIPEQYRVVPPSIVDLFMELARKGNEWAANLLKRVKQMTIKVLPEAV